MCVVWARPRVSFLSSSNELAADGTPTVSTPPPPPTLLLPRHASALSLPALSRSHHDGNKGGRGKETIEGVDGGRETA